MGKFQDVSLGLSGVPHLDGVVVRSGDPGVRARGGGRQRAYVVLMALPDLWFIAAPCLVKTHAQVGIPFLVYAVRYKTLLL